MRINVSNVLGISELEAEIKPGVTLVTGRHSAGKTSLARIIAALSTQTGNPAGLSVTLAKCYIKRGEPSGYAEIEDSVRWTPPDEFSNPKDEQPMTLPHCAGLINFREPSGTLKNRAAIFDRLSPPESNEALLRPAWEKRKYPANQLTAVLEILDNPNQGWDEAFKIYGERKTQAGRQWASTTNSRAYSKKAANWRPDHWSSELEGVSESDIVAKCTNADDALRACGVRHAIEQNDIDRAIEIRDEELPKLREELAKLVTEEVRVRAEAEPVQLEYKRLSADLERLKADALEQRQKAATAKNHLHHARQGAEIPLLECPHCKEPVEHRYGVLCLPERTSEDVVNDLTKELDTRIALATVAKQKFDDEVPGFQECKEKLGKYRTILGSLKQSQMSMRTEIAHKEQQCALADEKSTEGNEAERAELENARDEAYKQKDMWDRNRSAQLYHQEYVENQAIADLLGPSGVRAEHSKTFMDGLRKKLAIISKVTGWLPIEIQPDYTYTSNGWAIQLCAHNEQWKCQWAIQAAIHAMKPDEAGVLILDACDVIRGQDYTGLVRLANTLAKNRPSARIIVCATDTKPPAGWHEIRV